MKQNFFFKLIVNYLLKIKETDKLMFSLIVDLVWKLETKRFQTVSEINHGKDFLDFVSFVETHLANAIKLIPEVEKISEHLNRIKVNSSKSIKHKNTISYPPNFLGKRDHEHAKIHFGIGADSNIQKLLTTRGFNTGN